MHRETRIYFHTKVLHRLGGSNPPPTQKIKKKGDGSEGEKNGVFIFKKIYGATERQQSAAAAG